MLVRVDTGVAFLFWRSQLLFMDLFLRVPIRTINNQAIGSLSIGRLGEKVKAE